MNITTLPCNIIEKLERIQEADIAIGIADIKDTDGIKQILQAITFGMAKYFPELKPVVIKQKDKKNNTFETLDPYEDRELNFIYDPLIPIHRISIDYEENNRKSFLRQVFQAADILNCEACIILSGDMSSITPQWIESLVKPLIKGGFDYITPIYVTHKQDATINNNLVYPLIRGLYGINSRYPIGGDYGISIDLARTFLEKDIWNKDLDIDTSMISIAIGEGFEIGQSWLGVKSIEGDYDINLMEKNFKKIFKTLLYGMNIYKDTWISQNSYKNLPVFSFPYKINPKAINLNLKKYISKSKEQFKKFTHLLKEILIDSNYKNVEEIIISGEDKYVIDDNLWINVIIDYIGSSGLEEIDLKRLEALTPLYFMRIASFAKETMDLSQEEFENRLEILCNKLSERKNLITEKLDDR